MRGKTSKLGWEWTSKLGWELEEIPSKLGWEWEEKQVI